MASVVDGMCRVEGGLEDDASHDFARDVFVIDGNRDVCWVVQLFVAKGIRGISADAGRASGCLKLARSLPFRTTREPEHEPVIWVVFFGEVGREEEC